LRSALVEVLDAAKVAFTMVCPFGIDLLEGNAPEGTATPIDCGTALVVTVHPGSLAVEAAEDVVYQLCQVLLRYVYFLFILFLARRLAGPGLTFGSPSFDLGLMGVEICEAEAVYFNPALDASISGMGMSFEQVYNTNNPMLGTSIGPTGDGDSTGSLGFYVKIEYHGKTEAFAVTCHHVVAPGNASPSLLCPSARALVNTRRIFRH